MSLIDKVLLTVHYHLVTFKETSMTTLSKPNRKERRQKRILHARRMKNQFHLLETVDKEETLFDRVHNKFQSMPIKIQAIYHSVFCKG